MKREDRIAVAELCSKAHRALDLVLAAEAEEDPYADIVLFLARGLEAAASVYAAGAAPPDHEAALVTRGGVH